MPQRRLIGLSSGSSLNGVDAALVETEGNGLCLRPRLVHFLHQSYSRDLRELLLRSGSTNSLSLRQVAMLHRVLGENFASAARLVADQAKLALQNILCVGLAGHTLWHETEGRYPASLNIGMAAVVAERTGITTISDFRGRDVVVGGQGFPLTPLVDSMLFHDPREHRLLIHLGGVATILSLPAPAAASDGFDAEPGRRQIVGFQAAPCTILLDGLMRLLTSGREAYDTGGKHAVQGRCIEALLERWLAHPTLQKKPPKNMSRQEFGEDFLAQAVQFARHMRRNLHDLLCTATHFVVRAIALAIKRFIAKPVQRVLLSGGGVRNGLLWSLLAQHLAPVPVEKLDAFGIPAEARKAVGFAGLAALTMDGVPANLPDATGAAGPRLLGHITPGCGANWAHCLSWMAAQSTPLMRASGLQAAA
jgi:anhydro-N-acetylmuramic acid kinase